VTICILAFGFSSCTLAATSLLCPYIVEAPLTETPRQFSKLMSQHRTTSFKTLKIALVEQLSNWCSPTNCSKVFKSSFTYRRQKLNCSTQLISLVSLQLCRDVNKDQAFKAKAKDLAVKAKDLAVKAKDLAVKAKARTFRCNPSLAAQNY